MSNFTKVLTGAFLSIAVQQAIADNVGGGPKADFHAREFSVPCVQVTNLSDETEGTYYDVVMKQRGSSFNYEITFAEAEDSALCERIAEFAKYEDDDFDDGDDDADDDSDNPDAAILTQCEVSADRSRVSVTGKALMSGSYYVSLTSGENTVQSTSQDVTDDELEVDFDSDADDILEGAQEIDAGFIVDASVTASIFQNGSETPVVSSTVSCLTL